MFNFFKREKKLTCEQCKKTKKESEGDFVLGGSAFRCKECTSNSKGEVGEEKKDNTCEFC